MFKKILTLIIVSGISLWGMEIDSLKKQIEFYSIVIPKISQYKLDVSLNDIPYNFNPFEFKEKIKVGKIITTKEEHIIVKIIPVILLNHKAYIKYIKINSNGNRYTQNLWVSPGDKFDICEFKRIRGTKLYFKCNNKNIMVEFLPKIKFKGQK